jgi:hypothetical protein
MNQLGQQYFQSLQQGNVAAICQLFAKDVIVDSPLYGQKHHRDFYTELMEDSGSSSIEMKRIFSDPESRDLAIWFRYDWGLDNGERVVFEGVDVFELDEAGKIKKLTIIYDTVNTREMVEQMKKK